MFKHHHIEIDFLKHAGFKIKTPEGVIYVDPYQIKEPLEKADVILLTHTHYDHLDPNSIRLITKPETSVFCSHDAKEKLAEIAQFESVHPLYPGDKTIFGHLKIQATPAYNLNKNFHPKENDWIGFLLEFEHATLYFSGDTDYLKELESIQCDIGFFPVSGTYLMSAEEAAQLANIIQPKVVAIPMHYGTLKDDQGQPIGTLEDAKKFCSLYKGHSEILSPIG